MTDPEAPYYRHEITVVITTYQPRNDANALAEQIQQMLGPWCVAARVAQLNVNMTYAANKPAWCRNGHEVGQRGCALCEDLK